MRSGVYCILGPDGRAYIGCSKDVDGRFKIHVRWLNRGKHPNRWLQHAWAKYGAAAFEMTLLEEVQPVRQLMYVAEQRWLVHYSKLPGGIYNLSDVVSTTLGFKHGPEFRRKRREYMLTDKNPSRDPEVRLKKSIKAKATGYRPSPSTIAAMVAALKGKPRSQAFKDACARGQTGRVHSEKSRRQRGDKMRGRTYSPETLENMLIAQMNRRSIERIIKVRDLMRKEMDHVH